MSKEKIQSTISFSSPSNPHSLSSPSSNFSYFNFQISFHFTFGTHYTSQALGILHLGLSFFILALSNVRLSSQPNNIGLTWLLYYFSQSNKGRQPPEPLPFLACLHQIAISPLNHSDCLINYIWFQTIKGDLHNITGTRSLWKSCTDFHLKGLIQSVCQSCQNNQTATGGGGGCGDLQ